MFVLVLASMFTYLALLRQVHIQHTDHLMTVDESSPRDFSKLQQRIRYLETKVDSYMAFHRDPFLSQKATATCKDQSPIDEIACVGNSKCELDNSYICLDDIPFKVGDDENKQKKKGCVVYDFGIRESPDFGLAFAKQCQVVGFDPSPISVKWWETSKEKLQKEYFSYKFSPIGAGGIDGKVVLREYDWGQVSIIEFPIRVINTNACDTNGKCKYTFHNRQEGFAIPVKTLKTILEEQKHKRVSLLKLDVEGSEYAFLETMIDDLSCRKVDQLVLEWHHYDYDVRYGVTSNPQINVLVALLKERCGLEQFWVHPSRGWPSNQKLYAEMGMTLYYALSSFKRTRWEFWAEQKHKIIDHVDWSSCSGTFPPFLKQRKGKRRLITTIGIALLRIYGC